jgi:hypothetical protein
VSPDLLPAAAFRRRPELGSRLAVGHPQGLGVDAGVDDATLPQPGAGRDQPSATKQVKINSLAVPRPSGEQANDSVRPPEGADNLLGRCPGELFDLRFADGEHRVDQRRPQRGP